MIKILVTGAAGFIGSHLCDRLVNLKYHVIGVDNFSTGCRENIQQLFNKSNFDFYFKDLTTEFYLEPVDIIVHLASSIGQMMQHQDPAKHMINDEIINQSILEKAKKYNSKLIFSSTSEVYGKSNKIPMFECDDIVFGTSEKCRWGYATNKLLMEQMMFSNKNVHDLRISIVRLFNIIGKRQTGKYGMVVPRFIKQSLSGENLTIFGTGEQTRSFTYINDCIDALMFMIKDYRTDGQLFNIGNNEEISINELADRVISITKSSSGKEYFTYEQAYNKMYEDTLRRVPDITKIKNLVGWSPSTTIDESLAKMIV